MSNCKFETSNGRCGLKGCYAYRHKCFTEDLCKCHEPKTNADRIRAMSDDELADIVANGVGCVLKAPHCMDVDCTPCILKWLKQPFEGE